MTPPLTFLESHSVRVLKPSDEKEGRVWAVVAIETGLSLNDRYYTEAALRRAVPLFEGLQVCAYRYGDRLDHLPQQISDGSPGLVQNLVGWFESARFGSFKRPDGSGGEGILVDFHVMEGHKALRQNLLDAWKHGKADLLGFSIDAKGQAIDAIREGKHVKIVERIDEIRSTDVVSAPAAGGSILRLVASIKEPTMDGVIELIKQHRPVWLEGFAAPEDGQDLKDYAERVLESNLAKAQEELESVPVDEVQRLTEVARGVRTLNGVIGLIRQAKMQEGMRLLRNWIEVYPANGKGSAQSRAGGHYSFPYSAAQAGLWDGKPKPGAQKAKESTEHATEASKLGDAINRMKEQKNMSLEDLAKAINMTPEALMEIIETGRATDAQLRAIANALDGSFEDLKAMMTPETREALAIKKENEMDTETLKKKEEELAVQEASLKVRSKLMDSDLPEKVRNRISGMFEGKADVTDEALNKAITDEKAYIASFSESGNPEGLGGAHDDPAKIQVGKETKDKWDKAWDGLFAGSPVDGFMFHNLKEAWGAINNKWASPEQTALWIFESVAKAIPSRIVQWGIEDPIIAHCNRLKESWMRVTSQSLRETITTTDFSVGFGQALFRRLQKLFTEDPLSDWRKIISGTESLSDATNTFTIVRIGNTGTLATVAQNAPYQQFTDPTEVTEVLTPAKFGNLLQLTWEDVLADKIGIIRRIPAIIARSANRTIQQKVWDEIDTNPNQQDGNPLIDATHNNLVATNPALAYTPVTDAMLLLDDQTEQDSSEKMGLQGKFLLTGPKKKNEAWEIANSGVKVSSTEDATVKSFVNGMGIEAFSSIGLGRSTSPDTSFRWYVAVDPKDAEGIVIGFLGGRDRPDIFVQGTETPTSGSFFDADAITFKVRLVFGVKVVDFRWIAGSLATA